jgi:serine/threonine protein kinase
MDEMHCSLDKMLLHGRMDAVVIRHIVHGVASGVAYLHERPERILHGDLKLENAGVIRGRDGALNVLVADFGSAMASLASQSRQQSRCDITYNTLCSSHGVDAIGAVSTTSWRRPQAHD